MFISSWNRVLRLVFIVLPLLGNHVAAQCPDYAVYSQSAHDPPSTGNFKLPYMRPDPACRTFNSSEVEETIVRMKSVIQDPDLYRLFENTFPNSLDTAGGINISDYGRYKCKFLQFTRVHLPKQLSDLTVQAMWLRDSANQLQSYISLLKADAGPNSLASLFRGLINLQARYIIAAPFCNSFQPPAESGLAQTRNQDHPDEVTPKPDDVVFECKYELDSLAAFLEISSNYYEATGDIQFFRDFQWVRAISVIISTTESLLGGTYSANGSINMSPYTWQRYTKSAIETLSNSGRGNPVQGNTGLIRSAFRPSDDATTFQLFIPANMMFASYLESASNIMAAHGAQEQLSTRMSNFSRRIRDAISKHGIVNDAKYGEMYAYEVDGFGSANLMDDANVPSLLSAPFLRYNKMDDAVYQNTRRFILSSDNPYFMRGPVISAVGGPHAGLGMAWPMASIMRIFTTDDEAEIADALRELVASTAGLGLIHESVNSFDQKIWTRQWFSWANGLFGQCMLDLETRHAAVLARSYQ
ncbi:DUF1237 domain protein [Blumeria hordei DH14]|uniref:DUF1237 domain protein n=1 Tax=Blumeria graminis f. sp. hordei (strain DH14) TaxID=546991 RepID=N1J709_BLUG1|nr:DUF1237 domain protein [Blumeria hordei DH14]